MFSNYDASNMATALVSALASAEQLFDSKREEAEVHADLLREQLTEQEYRNRFQSYRD